MEVEALRALSALINDTSRTIRLRFDQRLAEIGLTRAQYLLLRQISAREGLRQIDLADLADVEPITMTRSLDRLEAAGLVERRADPADRRVKRLYLCPPARPLIEAGQAIGAAFVTDVFGSLDPEERRQLQALLTRIRARLNAMPAADAVTAPVA